MNCKGSEINEKLTSQTDPLKKKKGRTKDKENYRVQRKTDVHLLNKKESHKRSKYLTLTDQP